MKFKKTTFHLALLYNRRVRNFAFSFLFLNISSTDSSYKRNMVDKVEVIFEKLEKFEKYFALYWCFFYLWKILNLDWVQRKVPILTFILINYIKR